MDVDDPIPPDNFYDEIDSFMPPPGDFNLEDIDEILRSASDPSTLDPAFDFSTDLYNFDIKNEFNTDIKKDDLLNFHSTSNFINEKEEQRKSSTSSSAMDDDDFNPDEFMTFLNNNNMKLDEFSRDSSEYSNHSLLDNSNLPPRNTPSPTGSCSSSSGSSTSGIQSDASSIGSMTPAYMPQNDSETENQICGLDNRSELVNIENGNQSNNHFVVSSPTANLVPFSIPMVSIPANNGSVNSVTPTIIQPLPQIIQGTLIPLQTVPLNKITSTISNLPAPTPAKTETKIAPKVNLPTPSSIKITSASSNSNNTSIDGDIASKITPPANTKPKTIFLSSNDFKTLMQRMNSTGGNKAVNGNGGVKISGAINPQMPKIVMKTPNGKVITTNKIVQPLSSVNNKSANAQIMSKIVAGNGSQLVIKKQQPVSHQQQVTKSNIAPVSSEGNIFKGIIDEKIFKKQQRMIKNRESASLSRKKKKEYVVSLETRINNLEKENYSLKGENKSLRSQLVAFAQTCNCKHSNISEFILNSLNAAENKSHQNVKIAPKVSSKSFKQRMTAANVRKNVAVLFAMAFMVTLNVGNFQNFLNKNSLESTGMAEQGAAEESTLPQVATAAGGRRLLWVETEAEHNEKLNRSKREVELEVPPLHFLRPINRTNGNNNNNNNATIKTDPLHTDIGINQKENLRLASNLRKWIGGNANYLNLTLHDNFGNVKNLENPPNGFKLSPSSEYYDIKSYDLPLQNAPGITGNQKRKYYVDEGLSFGKKQRKLETDNEIEGHNSLDLFKPKITDEYLRLFKGIKRQDDTFYVLSFNMDHILLPASNYNKSARPKMSLMLPAGDPSLNGDIVLMQIDCEVTNTTELMLKSHMIPEKLRPHKYAKNPNDVANNETRDTQPKSRERFVRPVVRRAGEEQKQKAPEAIADTLTVKQKPVVRTYYIMGPKNQAAAAEASKKKPTIIKLRGNETVVNGVLSMKNSTLYAKMRETVVGGDVVAP